jgi:acyl carrier protein
MSVPDPVYQRLLCVAVRSLNLDLPLEELAAVTRLDEVTGLDSLAVLQFVFAVEKEFGITLEPSRLRVAFLADLPELAGYISKRLGATC